MLLAAFLSSGWTLSPRVGSHCCAPTSRHCGPLQMAKGFGAPKKGGGFGASKKAAAKSKRPEGNLVFEGQKTFDKHLKLFKSLEDPEDRSNMCDCYVRAEGNDKFWFVGKAVAKAGSCDDAALAMVAQKRLVLEHAKALVRELAMTTAPLQMWVAPANTEMRVAQKYEGLRRVDQLKRGALSADDCGYDPEHWTDPRLGFKVRLPGGPFTLSRTRARTRPEPEPTRTASRCACATMGSRWAGRRPRRSSRRRSCRTASRA